MSPYDRSPPSAGAESSPEAGNTGAARPRVLIVEDQALIALALAADLAAMGCEVVGRAASGEAAVALARRHAPDTRVREAVRRQSYEAPGGPVRIVG